MHETRFFLFLEILNNFFPSFSAERFKKHTKLNFVNIVTDIFERCMIDAMLLVGGETVWWYAFL